MPVNKLALIRYKTIDQCLQNKFRKWTLEDLMNACSEVIFEYEGIDVGVSKRTIQLDIQNMRSDKLGYEAPIVVYEKKYYKYENPEYSITNKALSANDTFILKDIIQTLQQFKGFSFFNEMATLVAKLENNLLEDKSEEPYILFEKNDGVKGLHWLDLLLGYIKNKQCLSILYQSFKAQNPSLINIVPYLLKEYRNRWFLLALNIKSKSLVIFALDRIQHIEIADDIYMPPQFDLKTYFDNAIGVSVMPNQETIEVVIKVLKENVPYVKTKPLHSSQKWILNEKDYSILSLHVIWNYELEREILGFGEQMEVLKPRRLRHKMKKKAMAMLANYEPQ